MAYEWKWGVNVQSNEAERILMSKGCFNSDSNFLYMVDVGGGHHESAWGYRLYGGLDFLCGHWQTSDSNNATRIAAGDSQA